jgi:putative ABC transport system ATP-binding protein
MYAVRAIDVTKVFGEGGTEVVALSNVTLDFTKGQFTAIMGPSGSGKSTLMHSLAGLESVTAGDIFVGDVEIGSLSDNDLTELRRDDIGFVFQTFNLIPTLTAMENIELPATIAGRTLDADWVEQLLDILGISDRVEHRPPELSGGERQRVAAARALAGKPEVIFADEPTGNLDSKSAHELLGFLRRAVDEFGQTIVMVTHDPSAAAYADTVIFLRDGVPVSTLINPDRDRILDEIKGLEN